jgi:hypothetical protein
VRGVLRDPLAGGAAGEQPDEHGELLDAGDDLFDAHRADAQLRHVAGQVRVALVGDRDDSSGLRDREVGAGHPCVGLEDQRAGVLTHDVGEVDRVGPVLVGAVDPVKQVGHVLGCLLEGRADDVARRLVVELLDAFAKVGLGDLDAVSLQERARIAFLGQH